MLFFVYLALPLGFTFAYVCVVYQHRPTVWSYIWHFLLLKHVWNFVADDVSATLRVSVWRCRL